jgi:hypothetical protein
MTTHQMFKYLWRKLRLLYGQTKSKTLIVEMIDVQNNHKILCMLIIKMKRNKFMKIASLKIKKISPIWLKYNENECSHRHMHNKMINIQNTLENFVWRKLNETKLQWPYTWNTKKTLKKNKIWSIVKKVSSSSLTQ